MPPRKSRKSVEPPQVEETQHVEEPADVGHQPTLLTKDDYLKAKATIKQFREEKKAKPKRVCSEKQLAALAQGRAKNKRFAKNQVKPSD